MNVIKLFQSVLVALLVTFSAHGAEVQKPVAKQAPFVSSEANPFRWKHVGVDICNPKVGCTLDWALPQTGWPTDVQSGLIAKVKDSRPSTYTMENGWKGWMTWGERQRKFQKYTVAEWGSGHTEWAALWYVERGGIRYNLIQVAECKNWGGFTSRSQQPPGLEKPPAPKPDVMPLGVPPRVSCI